MILKKREARFRLEAHTLLGGECLSQVLDRIYGPDCTEKDLRLGDVLMAVEQVIPYPDAQRSFVRGIFNDSMKMPELEAYVAQCRMEARKLKTDLEFAHERNRS